MEYKGYKSERAFYNAKLHALAVMVCGESGMKDYLAAEIGRVVSRRHATPISLFPNPEDFSTVDLTDQEAKQLYYDMLAAVKKMKANMKTSEKILGISGTGMTDQQRSKLIRITKYKFKWSAEVTFSKIVEFCPELVKRLTPWQIKQTKLLPLFNLINKEQANKIIKRLEKIEMKGIFK